MSMTLNSKVYDFANVVGSASRYAYRALGLAQLFSWVTARVTLPTSSAQPGKAKPPTKVRWDLRQVAAVSEDSACGCADDVRQYSTVFIEVYISGAADSADRADLLAQLRDLVDTTEFGLSITNLQQPYA